MRANGSIRRLPQAGIYMLCYFLLPPVLFAQEVKVYGGFLSDSLKIGEQTAYYLSARFPSDLTVLFPDSTYSFAPFEYEKKEYYITSTRQGISRDSAVYYLTTFEVDRVQFLRLPVFVVHASDCTAVQTPPDSVLIIQLVEQVPDTVTADKLPLRMNTAYQEVHYDLNFWLIVISIAAIVVLAIIIWLVFGKRIRRYFKARRLEKNHADFLETYAQLLKQLQTAFSALTAESALVTWKKYMEQLESRPYTKLTTRETLKLVKEPRLSEDLGRIDKAIYGHDTAVIQPLENLKRFADDQFRKKMKEVQHG
jgi:hypothetical protein